MVISQKQYNNFWFASLVLLLFVQYFRPQDIFPGLSGMPLFMPAAGIVLLFLFFSKNIKNIINTPQNQIIFAFVFWFVIMVPFSQVPGLAVKGLRDFMVYMPFVFSIPLLITDTKSLHRMVDVFIIIMIIIAIVANIQHGGGRYQNFVFGNFLTDPNDYSLYMVLMFPICFFMFLYERKSLTKRLFYLTGTTLAVASVIVSYSRGGFLGLIAVSGIVWLFSPNKKIMTLLTVVGIVCVLIFSPKDYTELVSTSFDTKQSTAQSRLTTWGLSIDMFIDHPIGIGINNTPGVMYRYDKNSDNPERMWGDVSHSFWFTSLAEGGIIGFIIMITLLTVNISNCIKLGRLKPLNDEMRFLKYFGRGYLGAMIGFLVSGTFLTVNYYPHLWYMTALIAAGFHLRTTVVKSTISQYTRPHKFEMSSNGHYQYTQ